MRRWLSEYPVKSISDPIVETILHEQRELTERISGKVVSDGKQPRSKGGG
jgi:hypothetical protein